MLLLLTPARYSFPHAAIGSTDKKLLSTDYTKKNDIKTAYFLKECLELFSLSQHQQWHILVFGDLNTCMLELIQIPNQWLTFPDQPISCNMCKNIYIRHAWILDLVIFRVGNNLMGEAVVVSFLLAHYHWVCHWQNSHTYLSQIYLRL